MQLTDGVLPDGAGNDALTHKFQNKPKDGLIWWCFSCHSAALIKR
jgi:hypothetical protein